MAMKRPGRTRAAAKKAGGTSGAAAAAAARPQAPALISLARFQLEVRKAGGGAGRKRAGLAGFAPDATRVARSRGTRSGASPVTASLLERFDPEDGAGNRLTTPVRQQPPGDSRCASYAMVSAMETWLCRQAGSVGGVPTLSVTHAFQRGNQQELIEPVARGAAKGILEEDCFESLAACPDAASRTWKATVKQVKGNWDDRPALLRQLLQDGKVLVIGILVDSTFAEFSGGTYAPTGACDLAHALCLIGFECTEDGTDAWIVKNSYGTGWGDAGYGRIPCGHPSMKPERVVYATEDVTRVQ